MVLIKLALLHLAGATIAHLPLGKQAIKPVYKQEFFAGGVMPLREKEPERKERLKLSRQKEEARPPREEARPPVYPESFFAGGEREIIKPVYPGSFFAGGVLRGYNNKPKLKPVYTQSFFGGP